MFRRQLLYIQFSCGFGMIKPGAQKIKRGVIRPKLCSVYRRGISKTAVYSVPNLSARSIMSHLSFRPWWWSVTEWTRLSAVGCVCVCTR